jgi:outer membrane protein assembly factor BamB
LELSGIWFSCLAPDGVSLFTVSREGVQQWSLVHTNQNLNGDWSVGTPVSIASLGTNFPPRATLVDQGTRLIAAGSACTAVIDLQNAKVLGRFPPPTATAFPMVAPDGTWWLYRQPDPEATWLARAGKPPVSRRLGVAGGQLALSPDKTCLVIAGSEHIQCFDTSDWKLRWSVPVEMHSQRSVPCAFSRHGAWVATSLLSNDAVLLEAASGRVLARLKPPAPALVFGLGFAQDDEILAVSTIRGVYVWNLPVLRRELAPLGLDWVDHPSL